VAVQPSSARVESAGQQEREELIGKYKPYRIEYNKQKGRYNDQVLSSSRCCAGAAWLVLESSRECMYEKYTPRFTAAVKTIYMHHIHV